MKAMICSPHGKTDFFVIVAGVLQGNILVLFLLIEYVLQMLIAQIKEGKKQMISCRSYS